MHFSDQCVSLHSIIFSHLAEVIHEVQSWSHQFYFLSLKIGVSIHHTSRLKNFSGTCSSSSSSLPILSLVRHMHLAEDKKNTRKLEISDIDTTISFLLHLFQSFVSRDFHKDG